MPEEKFISIEYNTWMSKYKPMEEENERLKKELDGGRIKVTVYLDSRWGRESMGVGADRPLGYLSVDTRTEPEYPYYFVKDRAFEQVVTAAVYEAIKKNHYGDKYYLGRSQAEQVASFWQKEVDKQSGKAN